MNRTISRTYDQQLRPTGYTAGTPDGTDPFIVNGAEASATWSRDTAGRLGSVTDGTDTFTYSVNAIGQRDSLTATGDAFFTGLNWSWSYNDHGELVEADDQSTAGHDRAYLYDSIGNREKTVDGLIGDLSSSSDTWVANSLNQYSTVAGYTPTPVYDDDGNLTSGPLPAAPSSTSSLVWDAENRLISATTGGNTITYTYDYQGRLTSATTGGNTTRYLYDGWNRIAEYDGTTQEAVYLWGLDLSGTPQGAGGVGGLLSYSTIASGSISNTFYPAYDGNGNVSEYVNASGAEVAHFEYDPFGNLTEDDQNNASEFPYRFSTKPQDAVTGLYYYGYRYFDPVTGRWPSRDPIGETGGINLYGMVANDAIGSWDYLGLKCYLLIEGSIVTKKGQYGYDMYKKMVDAAKRAGYEVRENAEAKDLTETQSDKACTEIILITHGHETGEITIPHKGKKLYPTPERAFNKRLKKGNMNKLTIRLSCCYWDKVCDPETTEKMKKDDIELKPVEVPQVIEEGEEGQIIQRDSFRKTAEYLEKLPAKNTQND